MTKNPTIRAAIEYIIATQLFPGDEKYDNHLARGLTEGMLSAVARDPDVRQAVTDVLYEVGAGEHLHTQQRASYRRDVADAVLRVLGGKEE